jgi:hypothetical protein
MEGKPRFSGVAPESDQSVGPEVSQWRERLNEGPWIGQQPETGGGAAEQTRVVQEVQQKEVEPAKSSQQQPESEYSAPKAAIDEALTDSKADIGAVQAMMEHFFEANKDV